jgi:hypothetical protein
VLVWFEPDLRYKGFKLGHLSAVKSSETCTCADSWHLNLPLWSAMDLKEMCSQCLSFVAAKTACNLRHDCLCARAPRGTSIVWGRL